MGWLDTFQRLVDEQVSEKGPVKTAAKLKASDKSVMDQPILRASFEEIEKQKAEEQALIGPTIFGISIDPTDYITPGGLAKVGAVLTKSISSAPMLVGVTAYHGSSHLFSKFSSSKIGTGEGAQAYGYGLYLAESPEVAKTYQKTFYNTRKTTEGYVYDIISPSGVAVKTVKSRKEAEELTQQAANLYKVAIPDETVARFLDWDKPLSQQQAGALFKENPVYSEFFNPYFIDDAITSGNMLYNKLAKELGSDKAASEYLASKGVFGIKYLDEQSRGYGTKIDEVRANIAKYQNKVDKLVNEGASTQDINVAKRMLDAGQARLNRMDNPTSNFVVFDDELIEMLEINSKPIVK